jgi:CheY-like chemotaxis protein
MVAEQMLGAAGMVVETAASGTEALELLGRETVDAVLMDVHMPGLDGMETTRRIRRMASGEDLPVIAMTAAVLDADRRHAAEAGMNAFLGKPFEAEEAIALLLECMDTGDADAGDRASVASARAGPDLDVERGLRLVRGNSELYADLLGQFEAELEDLLAEDEDGNEALSTDVDAVHRVKGTAAILGAETLSAAAERLEEALREGRRVDVAADALRDAVPTFSAARARYLASD